MIWILDTYSLLDDAFLPIQKSSPHVPVSALLKVNIKLFLFPTFNGLDFGSTFVHKKNNWFVYSLFTGLPTKDEMI